MRPLPARGARSHETVNPWVVTAAVTLGALMGALDTSIVNVALPFIRANLGVNVTEIAWVTTGYITALVIIMPLTAWLGTVVGRKLLYMSSLAAFTLASFFCGAAHTLPELLLARLIQGLGAGVMQPTVQAILREIFPPHRQGLAMGVFGFVVMAGPAIGPTLGGWITDNYNWNWIFYINVPIGFVALWAVWQFVYDPPHARRQVGQNNLDLVGILSLAVGLGCLQIVLEEGQTDDWFNSNFIINLSIAAAVGLCVFVWWELGMAKRPAVDLRILGNLPFANGTMIGGILGVSLFGSMFLMPLYMQELLGFTAMQSGIAMLPRALVMLLLLPIFGALYNHLGPRVMITGGLLTTGIASAIMARFTLDTSFWGLFWPQVMQGVGFSMIFVALSTAALASIERTRLSAATGLYNLIRQLGGSIGTTVFATMLTSSQQMAHARLAEHTSLYNPAFSLRLQALQGALQGRGFDASRAQRAAIGIMEGLLSRQAAMLAFERVFMVAALLLFACLPLAMMLRRPPGHHARAHTSAAAE